MTTKAVARRKKTAVAGLESTDNQLLDTLLGAAQQGLSIDYLEKFMDLAERNERREAEKAYHKAFASFKADPPKIVKDALVNYTTSKGTTKYKHATLGKIVDAIVTGMSKHGLSHHWTIEQDGKITVTCRITHELGHSESVAMSAPSDTSGGKNTIQAIASTVTYLERYTIQAATGIAILESDDDGRRSEEKLSKDDEKKQPYEEVKRTAEDWEEIFCKECGNDLQEIKTWRKKNGEKIRITITSQEEAGKLLKFLDGEERECASKPELTEGINCPETGLMSTEDECRNAQCSSTYAKCNGGSKLNINI